MAFFDKIIKEIDAYERDRENQEWMQRCDYVDKIYRDQDSDVVTPNGSPKGKRAYNVLWSNMQTLLPAIYARNPNPDVSRRFNASDPVAREASTVLERCLKYFVDNDEFMSTIRQVMFDWLLLGRGTAWVRYEPTIEQEEIQIENDLTEQLETTEKQYREKVTYEDLQIDLVQAADFGHNIAPTWQEVYLVWRKVRMGRNAITERFGSDVANDISYGNVNDFDQATYVSLDNAFQGNNVDKKTAIIYEVWDKSTKKVYFLQRNSKDFLDVKDDPLELKDFFPCPRPLYTNLTNRTLVPVPDYYQYFSQAEQLNILTQRITMVQKSLVVRGVYDKGAEGLQSLLEGLENKMYPVTMNDFGEKGGFENLIKFFPLEDISKALEYMYNAFEQTKMQLYELTGMSDILRGQGDAQETATGIRTKSSYALLRIEDKQKEAQRFVRDIMRIMGEIIAEKFSPEMVYKIGGEGILTEAMKQAVSMQQPVPELKYVRQDELEVMMSKPSFDDILQLLHDDPARCMRIDIETDSTIKQDQIQDRAERVEFLQSVAQYIKEVMPAAQENPTLVPVLAQLFMYGVRGYQVGKETEQVLSDWVQKNIQMSQQPQQERPDPKLQELEQKGQLEQMKLQQQAQVQQAQMQQEAQLEQLRIQNSLQIEREKMQLHAEFEKQKAQIELQLAQGIQEAQSRDTMMAAELDAQQQEKDLQAKMIIEENKNQLAKYKTDEDNKTRLEIANANKMEREKSDESV